VLSASQNLSYQVKQFSLNSYLAQNLACCNYISFYAIQGGIFDLLPNGTILGVLDLAMAVLLFKGNHFSVHFILFPFVSTPPHKTNRFQHHNSFGNGVRHVRSRFTSCYTLTGHPQAQGFVWRIFRWNITISVIFPVT